MMQETNKEHKKQQERKEINSKVSAKSQSALQSNGRTCADDQASGTIYRKTKETLIEVSFPQISWPI